MATTKSIEEKAKRYDDLLVKLQEAKVDNEVCDERYCCVIDDIVPELKESEDEKIKSAAIEFVRQNKSFNYCLGISKEEVIAWLEKQGNNINCIYDKELSKLLHVVICRYINDPNISYSERENVSKKVLPYVERLEKQNEQKPANTIEPKFKVKKGKWYVCIKDLLDNYANKAFRKGDIYLSTQDGSLIPSNSNVPYKVVCSDTYFRDWTIQDAKDGDVLVNKYGAIFINAGNSNGRGTLDCYCYLSVKNKFCIEKHKTGSWLYKDEIKPATKEQRNLLFQKMKEAGYEWSAEKKELKKIEPVVVRDFYSVFSREQVEQIDKRIEESQRLYNSKLRDAIRKIEDFPMTN